MINARNTMLKIGKIINKVFIALGALLLVLGIVGFVLTAVLDDTNYLIDAAGDLFGNGFWMLLSNIVALCLINKFDGIVNNGQDNVIKGSILIIVIGVISWNPFYILAGIFGIVAKDDINKANAAKPADEAEAPAEEDAFAGEAEAEPVAEAEVVEEAPAEEEKKDEE